MNLASPEHRAVIDRGLSPSTVAARFEALRARAPSDRVVFDQVGALTYREEPPWYFALTYGATQGLAIFTHLASTRTRHPLPAVTLAIALDAFAIYCLVRLLFALVWRLEIRGANGMLTLRERLGGRVIRERVHDIDDVSAIVVEGEPGRRRVVVQGARRASLDVVAVARALDPPGLPAWIADAVALIAGAER